MNNVLGYAVVGPEEETVRHYGFGQEDYLRAYHHAKSMNYDVWETTDGRLHALSYAHRA